MVTSTQSNWLIMCISLAVSLTGACPASAKDRHHFATFELRGSRHFANYNAVVGRYLRQESPHHRARACVVGQKIDGQKDEMAYVIWRRGDKFILWQAGDDNLNHSNRLLSLRDDVVATDEAVGTSTYLVSRPWVAMIERKCARYGHYVTVRPQ
jgi:hypothetical protein